MGQKAKGTARDRFFSSPRLGLAPILVPAKKVVLPNVRPCNPWVSQPVWLIYRWTGG